jgi:hypothetical protein
MDLKMNAITSYFDRQSLLNDFFSSKRSSFAGIVVVIALFTISLLILSYKQKATPIKTAILISSEVKEVPYADKQAREALVKITSQWKDLAISLCNNSDISTANKQKLSDTVKVLKTSSNDILYEGSRVFICLDTKKTCLQSIAVLQNNKDKLQLDLLATNPNNLYPNPSAVKGAGSKLLYHLFQTCLQENRTSIKLTSLQSSVSFYTKLGFEELGKRDMQITSEKIKTLIKRSIQKN